VSIWSTATLSTAPSYSGLAFPPAPENEKGSAE
jgi:hypothetical protein